MHTPSHDEALFNEQVKSVCQIYHDAQELHEKGIHVVSCDEKTGIQALERKITPIQPGQIERQDSIFITILAYHLLQTIRYQLKQQGINASWGCVRQLLSTHCRITTIAKLEDGRVIKIRKSNNPNVEQQQIYQALNLALIPGKTKKIIS